MAVEGRDKALLNEYAKESGTNDKNVPWYDAEPSEISQSARKLLESYSKIPSEKVTQHVIDVRERAWEVCPYPCIGQFRFIDMSMEQMPDYQEIVDRVKKGDTLLDMACCFGQEIRKLVSDGAPSENLYGCDLQKDFIDLGYDLFLDKSTLKSQFVVADIFNEQSDLHRLRGKMDMVYAGSFFHLFGWAQQVQASKEVVKLLKSKKGSMIVGRQIGSVKPDEREHKTNPHGVMYQHNVESFQEQWKEIGEEMGVKFTVTAYLTELAGTHQRFHNPSQTRRIWFKVVRE